MKKIIGCLVVALSLTSQAGAAALEGNDSVSIEFGKMYGHGVSEQLASGPDAAKLDKAEFIRGLQTVLKCDTSNVGYLMGLSFGTSMMQTQKQVKEKQKVDLNMDLFAQAFAEAFNSTEKVDMQGAQKNLMEMMTRVSNENRAKDPVAVANAAAGAKFMADLKKKDKKVKVTPSGLMYKVITPGKGAKFTDSDEVEVNYRGTHIDGTEFDKSKDKPVAMTPTRVVKGFGEAMKLMCPGAKYMVYIPGDLAYGLNGSGPIQPNETLIFELETVGLKQQPKKEDKADAKKVVAPSAATDAKAPEKK